MKHFKITQNLFYGTEGVSLYIFHYPHLEILKIELLY